jgi:hypothetical protein
MKGKLLILIILILIGVFYFNVIPLNSVSEKTLIEIEEKYNVSNGFMPSIELIDDYINDLIVLKSKKPNEKQFIEFKLSSAKGLKYLNDAQRKIDSTSPINPDCTSNGVILQAKKLLEKSRNELITARKTIDLIQYENKENFISSIQTFIDAGYVLETKANKLC